MGKAPVFRQFVLSLCASSLLAVANVQAGPVYFMVAEPLDSIQHFDSYVLPLFEPADIAKARELIQTGQQQIVFAAIAPGADGINRNVYNDQLWSWHVTQFEGFGDVGIELLDGWPTYVESDVPGWMANTGGHIGFWSYKVIAELPAVPEPSTFVLGAIGGIALISMARRGRGHEEEMTATEDTEVTESLKCSVAPTASDAFLMLSVSSVARSFLPSA